MLLAKINENNSVIEYPYKREKLAKDFPNISFAVIWGLSDLELLKSLGIVKVEPSPAPEVNVMTQRLIEINPVLADGAWKQTFEIVNLNDAEKQQELESLFNRYENMLSRHYDNVAAEKKYDSRITCALRAGFSGPYQEEGIAFAQWMDNCNAIAYNIMSEIASGSRPPVEMQELLDSLPTLTWPQ